MISNKWNASPASTFFQEEQRLFQANRLIFMAETPNPEASQNHDDAEAFDDRLDLLKAKVKDPAIVKKQVDAAITAMWNDEAKKTVNEYLTNPDATDIANLQAASSMSNPRMSEIMWKIKGGDAYLQAAAPLYRAQFVGTIEDYILEQANAASGEEKAKIQANGSKLIERLLAAEKSTELPVKESLRQGIRAVQSLDYINSSGLGGRFSNPAERGKLVQEMEKSGSGKQGLSPEGFPMGNENWQWKNAHVLTGALMMNVDSALLGSFELKNVVIKDGANPNEKIIIARMANGCEGNLFTALITNDAVPAATIPEDGANKTEGLRIIETSVTYPDRERAALADNLEKIDPGNIDVNDIKAIQTALNKLGFDPGDSDGDIGPITENALKKFQTTNGISPTGRTVDSATLTALIAALRQPTDASLKGKAESILPADTKSDFLPPPPPPKPKDEYENSEVGNGDLGEMFAHEMEYAIQKKEQYDQTINTLLQSVQQEKDTINQLNITISRMPDEQNKELAPLLFAIEDKIKAYDAFLKEHLEKNSPENVDDLQNQLISIRADITSLEKKIAGGSEDKEQGEAQDADETPEEEIDNAEKAIAIIDEELAKLETTTAEAAKLSDPELKTKYENYFAGAKEKLTDYRNIIAANPQDTDNFVLAAGLVLYIATRKGELDNLLKEQASKKPESADAADETGAEDAEVSSEPEPLEPITLKDLGEKIGNGHTLAWALQQTADGLEDNNPEKKDAVEQATKLKEQLAAIDRLREGLADAPLDKAIESLNKDITVLLQEVKDLRAENTLSQLQDLNDWLDALTADNLALQEIEVKVQKLPESDDKTKTLSEIEQLYQIEGEINNKIITARDAGVDIRQTIPLKAEMDAWKNKYTLFVDSLKATQPELIAEEKSAIDETGYFTITHMIYGLPDSVKTEITDNLSDRSDQLSNRMDALEKGDVGEQHAPEPLHRAYVNWHKQAKAFEEKLLRIKNKKPDADLPAEYPAL